MFLKLSSYRRKAFPEHSKEAPCRGRIYLTTRISSSTEAGTNLSFRFFAQGAHYERLFLLLQAEYDTGVSYADFRKIVWAHYKKQGRHTLPWRHTRSPYHVLVSEVMLQQTQVERVTPYYKDFIKKYPTAGRLAAAPLGSVLETWQGLGYNRRAKLLREAAQQVGRGIFPKRVEELEKLPGVGPYTARAVAAFAYNQDVVFVETNIRTAVLHHFFGKNVPAPRKVSDKQIAKILEQALPQGKAREWYSALMDYGAYLKQSGVRVNSKSKHYAKQSRFAGSNREARGAILHELARGPRSGPRLFGLFGDDSVLQLRSALAALRSEGLVQKRGRVFALPS